MNEREILNLIQRLPGVQQVCVCVSHSRYYAICCQPLVYRHKMTPLRVAGMLSGCWLIPTFISFLPIMQSWNAIGIEDIVSPRQLRLEIKKQRSSKLRVTLLF